MKRSITLLAMAAVTATAIPNIYCHPGLPKRYACNAPGNRRKPQAGDKLARKAAKGKIGIRG